MGENTEKCRTFSVPIKKELDNGKILCKIKFIDSFRFMSSSLSNLVDNLSEGLYNDKCIDCKSCLDYIFKCIEHSKNHIKQFNKDLSKRFENIYEFCDSDINKFILLLRKGVYPYKYRDCWERFNEELLPHKIFFYGNLKMEDTTDVSYRHAKRVIKNFNNNNLRDYHDLHVQSDTLWLADVFENFENKCIEIYELDTAHFL